MPTPANSKSTGLGVSNTAKFLTDIRTIIVIGVSVVVGIFLSGVYFNDTIGKFSAKLALVDKHEEAISGLATKAELTPISNQIQTVQDDLAKAGYVNEVSLAALLEKSGPVVDGKFPVMGGNIDKEARICPDGSYATGVRYKGVSGSICNGCLVDVEPICRKLPSPTP